MKALILSTALAIASLAAAPAHIVEAPQPYLAAQPRLDLMQVLPPPPTRGSPADRADRRTFIQTRRLRGGARWALAAADAKSDPFSIFACALGLRLTAQDAPALSKVLGRAGDVGTVDRVKQAYAKTRPYLGTDAPICEPKTAHLASNGDYPSGHTTSGWTTALILAELAPDRATQILARGRQFGESRFICGSHSVSAVQAGYLSGASIFAALQGSAAFRADMEAARREMDGLRQASSHPERTGCTGPGPSNSLSPLR